MKLTNFAIIKGKGQIIDGRVLYRPNTVPPTEENNYKISKNILDFEKYGELKIRSDQKFANGAIQFKIKAKSTNSGVLLMLKAQDGSSILCGPTLTEHKFAIAHHEENGKWRAFKVSGDIANYPVNQEIGIKVRVNGSTISLFVNQVLMCEVNVPVKEAPIEFRMASDQDLEIYDIEVSDSKPKIFVVMQFSKEYDELYSDVIVPVSNEFGYECVRGDEFYTGTPILKDIIDSILRSFAIIAEITPDNPNVFYEIGYAHAIGKPTILLCDRIIRNKLPFDLSGFRTLFYENTIAGKNRVQGSLRKYLENF